MTNPEPNTPALSMAAGGARHRQFRFIKDVVARHGVTFGGLGVIVAITLIFFYLLYVVLPLLRGVDVQQKARYALPGTGQTLLLSMEEQAEIGARLTASGHVVFFNTLDGKLLKNARLPIPRHAGITSIASAVMGGNLYAYGLDNGSAVVFRITYAVTFPEDKRLITPQIEFPLGDKPVRLGHGKQAIKTIALQQNEDGATIVSVTRSGVSLAVFSSGDSLLEEDAGWEQNNYKLPPTSDVVDYVLLDPDQRRLYLADRSANVTFYDISNKEESKIIEHISLRTGKGEMTSLEFLTGSISLLAGFSDGRVVQWFPVRDENNVEHLKQVRGFSSQRERVTAIAPEYFRKGFLVADGNGNVGIYHTTAERTLIVKPVTEQPIEKLAIGPRANAMLVEDATGNISFLHIHNEHPEVSWKSLWGEVWYEGHDKPKHIWQSSSASNDFEPKFSLTPLAFGTLKAAFYAMVVAIPLSIFGAIFTAYFMAPRMRNYVKPTIEIMEALPTVILGFLAGLWLAPYLEKQLPGVFALLIILPPGIVFFAWLWSRLPGRYRHFLADGWQGALLIPVVLILGWFALGSSSFLEAWLFDGDMPLWLSTSLGIDYDQRNAIVVGLAMGFAVIPTIFSIAEDAIFAVPQHLTNGSLALGATPWQTLVRVVLLTASPGIFSAIMIGLGRAVGETMIVLMATGNTPVLDMSLFQGMRTLSANIAVEMPESELNSTHYRVLFLAGLVLFLFTFFFNTLAELIRQRLRLKYSSL